MDKKEIIDYLSACIDAEQGVYETNRLVGEIDYKISEIQGRDYTSGDLIPKPKMEVVVFNEPEPEQLPLEDEEGIDKDIRNLEGKVNPSYEPFYTKKIKKSRQTILASVALCALILWVMTIGPVYNFLDSHRIIAILPFAFVFIFGLTAFRDSPFVGFFCMLPLIWALIHILTGLNILVGHSEKERVLILLGPSIVCTVVGLIIHLVKEISINKERIEIERADKFELAALKEKQAGIKERNAAVIEKHKEELDKYEKKKEQVLERKRKNNNDKKAQYAMTVKNAVLVSSLTADTLSAEKKKQKERNAYFRKKRDELYAKNYVHERFRNIAALMQIREYLEMGVADKLEGAYTEYLKDIRAEKIVGSIDSLRRTIEKGITVLAYGQATLYKELITANMNLNNLSYELSSNLKMIDNSIFDMKFDLEEAIRDEGYRNRDAFSNSINSVISYSNMINESNRDAYSSQLQQIVDSQRSLLDTVEKSSYNQYLVAKKENVDNYIYSSLRDPR